ncbi:ATP-dependent helicase [Pseudobutyrivibrio sp. MD2005]|uniref:ATP-dependent helicase n=1 Tax=Pseudobutyrivibrio sp. MD2005 TaxID=1410616 RepID=UPI000484FD02|nr:ATP-dependent helicase [Pseudobutyrivibrio sp. MD2005]
MELNSSQSEAVKHVDGPCLVLAGPGSGKTAVLTTRVFELIKSGIPAHEILVITFTKAAAIEMKERFDRLSDDIYSVTFGTFHSLFWGILQKEKGYRSSDILMGSARSKLLKQAMSIAGFAEDDNVLLNGLSQELSRYNNASCSLAEYMPKYVDREELRAFEKAYEGLKEKYRLIDFDDMLTKAYHMFVTQPDVLAKWQERYKYFLVDEMQDMNDIQFKLMMLISAKTRNIFGVGDDDQSIYGFRGANPRLMQRFLEEYPDAKQILLDYNYRNPLNVVKTAGNLISNNKNRFQKIIKGTAADGLIEINEYKNEEEEAEAIYIRIKKLIDEGVQYDEIAILYRNHSDARFLVNKMLTSKMPFYLKEQMPNIYTHFIINDLEAYFQIAIGNSTRARLLSIINRPNRYLHRRSVEEGNDFRGMLDFYRDNPSCYRAVEALASDIRLISKMSPCAAINYIKNVMGYGAFLKEEAYRNEADFSEYQMILDFILTVFKGLRTIKQAIDLLNELRLKIDYENKTRNVDKGGKIGMYTLHSSKGLEFKNVFIVEANEGIIPTNKVESKDDIEEERRLFYVGVTRTKRNLFLGYTNKKNRDKSRFLDELNYSSAKSSP